MYCKRFVRVNAIKYIFGNELVFKDSTNKLSAIFNQ